MQCCHLGCGGDSGGFAGDFWGEQEELEAERGRLAREQEGLTAELAAARRQRESEKQQVGGLGVPPSPSQLLCRPPPAEPCPPQALALQEEERAALAETLGGLQRSLAEATAELEQQRREVTSHQEKEQVSGWVGALGPPPNGTEPHVSPTASLCAWASPLIATPDA